MQGDSQEAIKYYKTFLGYYPDNTEARENLASTYLKIDKYQDAADEYATLYTKDPQGFVEYSNYGLALLRSGDYTNSVEMLKKAVSLEPADYASHANMALSYVRLAKDELIFISKDLKL